MKRGVMKYDVDEDDLGCEKWVLLATYDQCEKSKEKDEQEKNSPRKV